MAFCHRRPPAARPAGARPPVSTHYLLAKHLKTSSLPYAQPNEAHLRILQESLVKLPVDPMLLAAAATHSCPRTLGEVRRGDPAAKGDELSASCCLSQNKRRTG